MSKSSHSNTLIGWREWVSLPDLGVDWLKAKIDTGARTSSLHAFEIQEFERDGVSWVRFRVKPWQDSQEDAVIVESPVHDRRAVRSSSGHAQERLVVEMLIRLHDREVLAEVTLSNRDAVSYTHLTLPTIYSV